MSPARKTTTDSNNQDTLLTMMDAWPQSWAGTKDDIPFGEGLVAEMKPFVIQLHSLVLSDKTIRRHLDNLWVIGGEIIREINYYPKQAKKSPQQLLCETIANGEAPFIQDFSESEQRALDATAKKLQKYLLSTYIF
ncbi:MAG: hypothetical protein JXX29_03390 [Deltaproteobacteria bacterium]|nr:hypothetical protein [Deltaproteobacteria bacterium]